jgi:hypothetical protein
MRSRKDAAENGNPTLQPTSLDSFRLSQRVVSQYTGCLRGEPLGHVMSGAWNSTTSVTTFGKEIGSKYARGELPRGWTGPMIYRMLAPTLSPMSPNVLITVPLSFTVAPVVAMSSASLWLRRQAPTSFPSVANDRLSVVQNSVERRGSRVGDSQRPGSGPLGRFAMPGNLPRVLLSPHVAASEASATRTDNQHQRMPALFGLLRWRLVTQNVTAGIGVFGRQAPHQQRIQSAQLGTAQRTAFVHQTSWGNGSPAAQGNATPTIRITPQPSFQPEIIAPAPMLLSLFDKRLGITPAGTFHSEGLQLGAVTHTGARAKASEQRSIPAAVYASVPISLVRALPLTPQERQTTESWQSTPGAWLVPSRQQELGVSTIDARESMIDHGVAHDLQQLIVLRQEEGLQPPSLHYAYVPPTRPIAQDEHVVAKLRETEVVKVVQKEVQALMSSGSIAKYFSRRDYTHLTDSVYSSFIKRILVEKERMGIR